MTLRAAAATFTQRRVEAQPLFVDGALRFDGEASFLERTGPKVTLEDFTLFIVAAPFSNSGGFRAFLAMHQEEPGRLHERPDRRYGRGVHRQFDALNVEGKGFGGMTNLMSVPSDFGVVRQMTISSASGLEGRRARRRRGGPVA